MNEQTVNRIDHIVQITLELKASLKGEGLLDEESDSALSRIHNQAVGAKRITIMCLNRGKAQKGRED